MKEKKLNDLSFIHKKIAEGKKFVVTMNGADFAGFDTMKEAESYIKMQKEKKRGGNQPAAAATKDWNVRFVE